jgi:hypothetical protein
MSPNGPDLHSRYVAVGESLHGVALTYKPSAELTLGSARLETQALSRVANAVRRAKPLAMTIEHPKLEATFDQAMASELPALLARIDALLDAFKKEGLHPRAVEEILGISSRERLRWTKACRLPKAVAGSFRAGPLSIYFAMYAASKIAELAKNPDVIRSWRDADIARASETLAEKPQGNSKERELGIDTKPA